MSSTLGSLGAGTQRAESDPTGDRLVSTSAAELSPGVGETNGSGLEPGPVGGQDLLGELRVRPGNGAREHQGAEHLAELLHGARLAGCRESVPNQMWLRYSSHMVPAAAVDNLT